MGRARKSAGRIAKQTAITSLTAVCFGFESDFVVTAIFIQLFL